ncbi:MAG: hypothetical protein JSS56_04650 [Proteobacteria bacterium]|nr:hypothetical protein [Pseudomonadota bacterium]
MATKKTKQVRREPVSESKKTEEEDDTPLPGKLERDFRRSLGRHNLHLNMLEISARAFADTLSTQANEASYIRDCAKKQGFHSLYPDASFASARIYLVYSHIAYVFSAGDMLCDRIRATRSMKALKSADETLFNAIDKGDFVRKTLALAVLATMPPESRDADTVIKRLTQFQTHESFALVNYFRLVRNEELHASEESDRKTTAAWNALPAARIEAQFGAMPTAPMGQLNSQDALLCSKAWQYVAKWLCRHMLNGAEGQAMIKKRFGRLRTDRRDAAARKFLKLELLYSTEDIDEAMSTIRW